MRNFICYNIVNSPPLLWEIMLKGGSVVPTLLDKYYNVRIKLRNDSHSNWKIQEENGFRPYDGEIIIYDILEEAEAANLNMPPIPF